MMHRALRAGLAGAVLCAVATDTAGSINVPMTTPPPLAVDVRGDRTTFAGVTLALARARGEGAELLALVRPQATVELNRVATESLVAALRRSLPELTVTGEPGTPIEGPLHAIDAPTGGGVVRVAIPGPFDDARLRATVERARLAMSALDWRALAGGARITDVALGLARCEGFKRSADAEAIEHVDALTKAFAPRAGASTSIADRTTRPAGGSLEPLCGGDPHARRYPLGRVLLPTTAEAREWRTYAFATTLPRIVVPPSGATPSVADEPFGGGPWSLVRLRVAARPATLTVYGFALVPIAYAGAKYVWRGQNATVTPTDQRRDVLAEALHRLRALKIPDADVIAQHDPAFGFPFVQVDTRELVPRDEIVAAIAGDREAERRRVRFVRYRDGCGPSAGDLRRALADASARAAQLAAMLSATVDSAHPLAIALPNATVGDCATRDTAPYDERIVHRISGSPSAARPGMVAVSVTYPLTGSPRVTAHGGSDAGIDEIVARTVLVAPPIDHPGSAFSGDAQAQSMLPATDVLLRAIFDPDSEHGFRAVDESLPGTFLARVRAVPALSGATRMAIIPEYGGNPDASTDELQAVARVPVRPALANDLERLGLDLNRFGNVRIDALPMRAECDRAGIDAVRRAIAAAAEDAALRAAAAHRHLGRIIAIDLTGPIVTQGSCRLGFDATRATDARRTAMEVTVGAHARVVFE
jgi:hypothetical protein